MRRLLPILALILALHPISGATGVNGQGLGELLRALFCGCPSCAQEQPEESSCCSDQESECPCTHELELPDEEPLAVTGGTRAPTEQAAALAWLAAVTPAEWLAAQESELAHEAHGPPGRRMPCGPRELVAKLCTARI